MSVWRLLSMLLWSAAKIGGCHHRERRLAAVGRTGQLVGSRRESVENSLESRPLKHNRRHRRRLRLDLSIALVVHSREPALEKVRQVGHEPPSRLRWQMKGLTAGSATVVAKAGGTRCGGGGRTNACHLAVGLRRALFPIPRSARTRLAVLATVACALSRRAGWKCRRRRRSSDAAVGTFGGDALEVGGVRKAERTQRAGGHL
mmetsp:Transcript_10902/g.33603  ORF Transcript_10902/g.33603 Transcript_10902/m.33603 type:complete len:203 (-) Transcript_10902:398-1006(-)